MHGDHEPGQPPAFLPPFVARPRQPSDAAGSSQPLPPWSSAGHEVPSEAQPGAPAEAQEAPWTPAPALDAQDPWSDAPEPSADEQTPASAGNEPWPGFEPEPAPASRAEADDPWAPPPEPEPGEEPWAGPDSAATVEAAADGEPWLLDATEAEPLILDEPTDEPLMLDDPAAEPWLAEDEDLVADAEPWSAVGAAEPWAEQEQEEEAEAGEPEPWTSAHAEPAPPIPADRAESDLPPAPASPLDELVETAGQALAGGSSSWVEAPLATWPGEAEAWNTVAAASDAEVVAEARRADPELLAVADALEDLARDLRTRGSGALEPSGQDRLGTALASFIAGWRAARGNG